MLKVIVFDGGWGGELVANFLEEELNIIDVVRVIDWKNAPYETKDAETILELAQAALRPYIGKCDLIVLGGYATSRALSALKRLYPEQSFVGLTIQQKEMLRMCKNKRNVMILAGVETARAVALRNLQMKLPQSRIDILDCMGWETLVDNNSITRDYLYRYFGSRYLVMAQPKKAPKNTMKPLSLYAQIKLEKADDENSDDVAMTIHRLEQASLAVKANEESMMVVNLEEKISEQVQPDIVFLLNSHFWDLKFDLERIFGWKTRVVDFRNKLLRDVCVALKLPGVDGKRPK